MNSRIKELADSLIITCSEDDIEKLVNAVVKKSAELNDSWDNSGEFLTFGDRLLDYFGVKKQ